MNNIFYFISSGALALIPAVAGSTPITKQCVQLEVPIPVVATNDHFIMPRIDSNIDAIGWTVNVTTWSTRSFSDRITGPVYVNCTFTINAQLCVPSQKTSKAGILQIGTQGNGWDKRYWDVEIQPEKYSYLDAAIERGYSVLTYDRIGTGKSDKPNAYDIVQAPTEIEALAGLTKLARSGKLISSSKVLSAADSKGVVADFRPSKIVHVGHSYGSLLISSMLVQYGDLGDGAILSGYFFSSEQGKIDVGHFDHEFAKEHDPVRFGEYPSGYFVLTTESDLQKLYFRKGGFEPELLTYAEKIKQPEGVGIYGSEGIYMPEAAPEFKGPVQLLVGEFDYLLCDGDCRGTYLEDYAHSLFPVAANVSAYMQPNTGHALALATNAPAGFEAILQYLDSNGL
ncbi:hypothetical protein GQ53DRAFT_718383 [Thozetella sp. PMI_491]|nr:hypothetical protein GQ53DRAFT_718383 [Thozetella sp. PMI_491]